ncbi:MAG TPA: hypothetical protein VN948_18350 [Terriglobales bacterium]|nr:hypothetical protein [Terriglobales bacterium]
MKRLSGPRKTANLSESVHQQLNMYALAAGAAGVGMLALAQPSEAKIVYRHTNVVVGLNGLSIYGLDLNHDGISDVIIRADRTRFDCQTHGGFELSLWEIPTSNNGVEGQPPTPLRAGAPIGGRQHFYSGKGSLATSNFFYAGRSCQHGGNWWSVTDRYLGVKFKIHRKTHYGWARLTFDRGRNATLTGYAYETIANKSIKAGQTKGRADDSTLNPDSANPDDFGPGATVTNPIPDTPQPASLGVLALGAQGVPLWRRKESALEGSRN